MKVWQLEAGDIDRIALGVGILGTGGGGNPYLGAVAAKQQLAEGRRIRVIQPSALDDDALVLALGGIGAPTVSVEKMWEGEEGVRLVQAIEQHTGRKVQAVIADEVGGANGIVPMLTAAQLDLPVVDGDGMGRAFPEVQMTTFFINGQDTSPAAIADADGNVMTVTSACSPLWLERLLRAATVAMGCTALMSSPPMRGAFIKQYAVPLTLSQAWQLGDAVLSAQQAKHSPVAAILRESHGRLLFSGKVVDVGRSIAGGFVRGQLRLGGLEAFTGQTLEIDIQNEYLVARSNGQVLLTVPDLIAIVDSETGRPIGTEEQRYGLRVAVIGIPAPALLRTPQALAVVGPAAFGYQLPYSPLAEALSPQAAAGYS